LAHAISWWELLNKRLHGNDFFDVDQKETFQWQRFGNDQETARENLLTSLEENQKQIIYSLKITDDTLLEQKVVHRDYTYRYLIQSIIRHDIYHFGQIAYLE
jgi:uncharacterized damage-inducible protein DinB